MNYNRLRLIYPVGRWVRQTARLAGEKQTLILVLCCLPFVAYAGRRVVTSIHLANAEKTAEARKESRLEALADFSGEYPFMMNSCGPEERTHAPSSADEMDAEDSRFPANAAPKVPHHLPDWIGPFRIQVGTTYNAAAARNMSEEIVRVGGGPALIQQEGPLYRVQSRPCVSLEDYAQMFRKLSDSFVFPVGTGNSHDGNTSVTARIYSLGKSDGTGPVQAPESASYSARRLLGISEFVFQTLCSEILSGMNCPTRFRWSSQTWWDAEAQRLVIIADPVFINDLDWYVAALGGKAEGGPISSPSAISRKELVPVSSAVLVELPNDADKPSPCVASDTDFSLPSYGSCGSSVSILPFHRMINGLRNSVEQDETKRMGAEPFRELVHIDSGERRQAF